MSGLGVGLGVGSGVGVGVARRLLHRRTAGALQRARGALTLTLTLTLTLKVHFSVHEGQLHLLAKLLEYSFNYSRFLPNW